MVQFDEGYETWMLSSDNASIGEARTKALLLDRFWVLERTIDAEGADHIIQRRKPSSSLLGPIPPRLGYIQTKFRMNFATEEVGIKEEYLFHDGKAKPGFFLIIHTGYEENREIYFFTSKELLTDNFLTWRFDAKKKKRYLKLNSKNISYYKRTNTKILELIQLEMNKIEEGFIYEIIKAKHVSVNAIINEPYRGNDENLEMAFKSVKTKSFDILKQYDDILVTLRQMIVETDPNKIENLFDIIRNEVANIELERCVGNLKGFLDDFNTNFNWDAYNRSFDPPMPGE